ncbi:MAG: methyltransferase domain-containing protein [Thermoplasmata archaeon]|nr:methyltransferase domain-containing protein [Thermoplasmata archaeon]
MQHLIELSGESESLARAEALAVSRIFDASASVLDSDIRSIIIEGDFETFQLAERLALAWSASKHIFSGHENELPSFLEDLKLPGKTFMAKTKRLGTQEPEVGMALTRKIGGLLSESYKVDLGNPDVEVRALMASKIHLGILSGEIDRSSFESRKSEYRPFSHPISLHPRLARALVNLTGIKPSQTILDPFCGTGGILLEAGLMGCNILGGDIDQRMIDGSIQNLKHYAIENPDIRKMDISDWPNEIQLVDAIATDPPYGRSASTAREPIESLYKRAFEMSQKILKPGGKLAIILPDEKHTELSSLELEIIEPVRVHKSLTRYFCVFKN